MGNICQAVNIVTGEKLALLVEPELIDQQDVAGIEKLLRAKVKLAPSDCSIYIQITEK